MEQLAGKLSKKFTKIEKSWIMYDWANSIYATNIMAAIFPIYFGIISTDLGDKVFGYAVSLANLIIAVLAPMLGAIGDFTGMKKKLFTAFVAIGVVFTGAMAFVNDWQWMLVGYVLSRIGFSGSCLFYDSFLTDVTTPARMDRVSSWGYAAGYIGGSTIPFIISIAVMMLMEQSVLSYKIAILIVVVWWTIFSIPFLKNVKQVHSVEEPPARLAKAAFKNAVKTFRDIVKDKRILTFILAYFFYIDGVDTIISLATKYGNTLGLGTIGMILALLVTQIVAVPFSILFGNLAKKVGGIRMISIAVAVYFVITILGFGMGQNVEPYLHQYNTQLSAAVEGVSFADGKDNKVWLEVVEDVKSGGRDLLASDARGEEFAAMIDVLQTGIADAENGKYAFTSAAARENAVAAVSNIEADLGGLMNDASSLKALQDHRGVSSILFWALAVLVGTVQGGIQALSRSYFGQLIPPERSNEFYGFLDIFGKFSCVIGPALYSLVYSLTDRSSLGILSIILLFLAAGVTLIVGRKHLRRAPDEAVPSPEA
ncbi:MAG TPA: MFS transporter [Clostridia bacterium]|nr:MFS transporter [Clostridia bacterium]